MAETGGSFGDRKQFQGAGGTPGGVGEFFIGLALFAVGVYLLFNRVTVHTAFWNFGGRNGFGISLIPVVIGIAVLFFNGRSILGWVLTIGGLLFILVGVISNMDIYFERTSLWSTLTMLALLGAGMGLIAKGLRPHRPDAGWDAS
jgi:O-antigen ligase